MNKPNIALIPLYDSERKSLWMLPEYMEGILEAGGIPVMLPLSEDTGVLDALAERYDGFLFTGGQDIAPSVYGMEKSALCGEVCPHRDAMEGYLLNRVLEGNKPVLGICRGLQLMNAVLGGTLYQDIPSELPSELIHRQKRPYDVPSHSVSLMPRTPLRQLLDTENMGVNSLHHQGIHRLSDRLQPMARAEDGLIEAAWMPEADFVWGVQWHPEFSFAGDQYSRKILRAFVEAAGGRAE